MQPDLDFVRRFVGDATGQASRAWKVDEFTLNPPRKPRGAWDDDAEEKEEPPDPGAQNLTRLIAPNNVQMSMAHPMVPEHYAFLDMPEVLVNLSGTGTNGRAQYLKAKIVLEVADQKLADEIKPVLPRVLDSFQTYLREMRSTDLEGSAGLYRVRDELTRRVNLAVAPSRINAVLFKEIVVQ